jgi:hypothetical protein
MRDITFGTVLKFLLLCFIVGFLLTKFGISPTAFWRGAVDIVRYLIDNLRSILSWGFIYIVAGAAVVLPIYGIILLKRYFSRKS